MPQIVQKELNNAAGSPQTYVPIMPQDGDLPARWVNESASTFVAGRPSVTVRTYRSATANKSRLQITVPSVDADGKLVHKCLATLDLVNPDSATQTQIDDAYATLYAAMTDTDISTAVRLGHRIF